MRRLGTMALLAVAGLAMTASPATADEACPILALGACPAPAPTVPEPTVPATTTTVVNPPAPAPQPSVAEATTRLVALVNGERQRAGLAPLVQRADVAAIAAGWSRTLAERGALSHDDAYFTSETRRRLGAAVLGENVAYAGDIETAHRTLMASEHHRDNILDPRFTVAGFGVALVDGRWWVTQDFVQPAATAPSPARPTSPAARPTAARASVASAPEPAVTALPPAPTTSSTVATRPDAGSTSDAATVLRHREAEVAGVGAALPQPRGRAAAVAMLAVAVAGMAVARTRSRARS